MREVYLTKYQIYILILSDIFVTILMLATLFFKGFKFEDLVISVLILAFLYVISAVSYIFYKKKIPIYKLKE